MDHAGIVGDVQSGFYRAEIADAGFAWRTAQKIAFNLEPIEDGYVPDLIVVNAEVDEAANKARAGFLLPPQISLVVEVTSVWSAKEDREPGARRERRSKWNGYAMVGGPF